MGTTYTYQPLPAKGAIRVLKLQPGRKDDPLKCDFKQVSLVSTPVSNYEALSYVWGSVEAPRFIFCGSDQIQITENCFQALSHLRFRFKTRILWVDAICIDQSSTSEKEQQISQMGDVYRLAHMTIAWIGTSTRLKRWIIRTWNLMDYPVYAQIKRKLVKCPATPSPSLDVLFEQEHKFLRIGSFAKKLVVFLGRIVHPSGSVILETKDIVQNEYFERTWASQEYILGSNCVILCGGMRLSPQTLYMFAAGINRTDFAGNMSWEHEYNNCQRWLTIRALLVSLSNSAVKSRPDGPIPRFIQSSMLRSMILSKATRDHDKVFGMYGIGSLINFQLPRPDYEASIELVYTKATLAFIKAFHSLDSLHFANFGQTRSLPTWVVDWRIPSTFETHYGSNALNMLVQLTPDSRLMFNGIQDTTQELDVKGIRVGNIDQCSTSRSQASSIPITDGELTVFEFIELVLSSHRWAKIAEPSAISEAVANVIMYPGPIATQKSVWAQAMSMLAAMSETQITSEFLTSVANYHDATGQVVRDLDLQRLKKKCPDWLYLWSRYIEDRAGDGSIGPATDWVLILGVIYIYFFPASLFTTSSNRIGFTLQAIQTGDIVVRLQGTSIPMIIRPKEQKFELVGYCYLQGEMTGGLAEEELERAEQFVLV